MTGDDIPIDEIPIEDDAGDADTGDAGDDPSSGDPNGVNETGDGNETGGNETAGAGVRFPLLNRIVPNPAEQRSIAPVLGLTLAAMLLNPILGNTDRGRGLEVAVLGFSAIVALTRTGTRPVIRHTGTAIVALATVVAAVIPVAHDGRTGTLQTVASGLFALLLMVTPLLVMVRLMLRPKITLDTLAGALTAYLQIGIFFGALYLFVSLVQDPTPFFAQTATPHYSDFEYFSFITMTTVGYGDLTPAGSLGQTLATFEAVGGQVFLVTVVALTVSNLGRSTRRGRAT